MVRDAYVLELEAEVAALRAALRARSEELRRLQDVLCQADLLALSRLRRGLPVETLADREPLSWLETTEVVEADVLESLRAIWSRSSGLARWPQVFP